MLGREWRRLSATHCASHAVWKKAGWWLTGGDIRAWPALRPTHHAPAVICLLLIVCLMLQIGSKCLVDRQFSRSIGQSHLRTLFACQEADIQQETVPFGSTQDA